MSERIIDNDIERAEQDRETMIQEILSLNSRNWSRSSLERKKDKQLRNILKEEQEKAK